MTCLGARLLTIGAVLGWTLGLIVPLLGRHTVRVEVLILADMVILSAAITSTVLAVVVRSLPPVAAAWFLGYREATLTPEKDDGRRLHAVGD